MSVKSKNMIVTGVVALTVLAVTFTLFVLPFGIALEPSGANSTFVKSGTAPNDTATSQPAIAGNVSEVTIRGFSTTQTWQGYYGNVTGTIQLADSNDNVFYNWTSASPEGEVMASTNQTITWSSIQCFNFTATGTHTSQAAETGGATNLNGTNLTFLETRFNVSSDDYDGVNETFTLTGAGTHDQFFIANRQFSEGECWSTRAFSSGGQVSNQFEEVLLYEPLSTSVVFTALIEDSLSGFDSQAHDFEMLVLENGHGTDTSTTPYYFFVELQ